MWKTLNKIGSIGVITEPLPPCDDTLRVAERLNDEIRRVLGRALCSAQHGGMAAFSMKRET